MEEPEIKLEFIQVQDLPCPTCLSIGRTLSPLGLYADIYSRIVNQVDETSTLLSNMEVCWECRAMLQKMTRFQFRAIKANDTLSTHILGQSDIHKPLSSLTIRYSHPNTLDCSEQNQQTINIKAEQYEDNEEKNILTDDKDVGFTENDCSQLETPEVTANDGMDIKEEKIKIIHVSHWHKAKKLENKKPKFKILTIKELSKSSTMFEKVNIDINEVYERMKNERNSKRFKRRKFKCKSCVLSFRNESHMLVHLKKHEKSLPYVCEICQSGFQLKSHLVIHIKRHFYKYQCTICGYSSYEKRNRYRHNMRHAEVFQCLKCELKFRSRKDFKVHHKEWHEKFICDLCGISFKMRYTIIKHLRTIHSPRVCKICNKQFKSYRGLRAHNKARHTPHTPAYCVECDVRFVDVARYKWHIRNSTKHRPKKRVKIPCTEPSCDKTFSKITYMKDHYNLVHLKNYKYRCEECDKNFIRNAELTAHRRRVHEGIMPPKNKTCYLCGRGFTTKLILEHHIRTHTGERPHVCACGASFAQAAALYSHNKSRHRAHVGNKSHPVI